MCRPDLPRGPRGRPRRRGNRCTAPIGPLCEVGARQRRHRPRPPPNGGSIARTCAHVIPASEAAKNGDGMVGELPAQSHCVLTHKLRPVRTSGCPPASSPGAQVPSPGLILSPANTGAVPLNGDGAHAGDGRNPKPRRGGTGRVHPRLLCAQVAALRPAYVFWRKPKSGAMYCTGPLNSQEMTCEFGAVGTGLGRGGGSRALSGGRRTNAKRPEWCPIDTAAGMSLSFCRALATPPVPSSTVACWRAALCSRWRAPARPPHGKGAAGLLFQALGRCPAPSCCAPCSSAQPARSKSPAIAPRLVPAPRGLWPGLGLCAAVAAGRRGQVGGAVLGSRLPPPISALRAPLTSAS